MSSTLEQRAVSIDPETVAFYLEVPRSHVVLLQVFFELYDGAGTVRTLDKDVAIACVLTTPSYLQTCIGVLEAIKEHVAWSLCSSIPAGVLPDDRP